MRAAVVQRVQDIDIAGPHVAGIEADHGVDRFPHRAQVHRHVRRVGDQAALGVEQRSEEHTSELQSLAYLVCRLLLEKKKQGTTRTGGLMSTASLNSATPC